MTLWRILGLSFGFTEEYINGIALKVDKDEGKGWKKSLKEVVMQKNKKD